MTAIPPANELLQALFAAAPADHFLEIRALGPDGRPQSRRFHRIGDPRRFGFEGAVPTGLAGKANVHFGVLPHCRRGGKAGDVTVTTYLWTDCDHALSAWPQALPPPSTWPEEVLPDPRLRFHVEFQVTRERIRQIEAEALRKLRHPTCSKKLRDFLE